MPNACEGDGHISPAYSYSDLTLSGFIHRHRICSKPAPLCSLKKSFLFQGSACGDDSKSSFMVVARLMFFSPRSFMLQWQ